MLTDSIFSMSLCEQVKQDRDRLSKEKATALRDLLATRTSISVVKPLRPDRKGVNSEVVIEKKLAQSKWNYCLCSNFYKWRSISFQWLKVWQSQLQRELKTNRVFRVSLKYLPRFQQQIMLHQIFQPLARQVRLRPSNLFQLLKLQLP